MDFGAWERPGELDASERMDDKFQMKAADVAQHRQTMKKAAEAVNGAPAPATPAAKPEPRPSAPARQVEQPVQPLSPSARSP
jgi:hypothetical protein